MAFFVEPVLAYVKAFNQRADRLEMRGAVLNCYESIAIRKAKEVLWAECGTKLEELKLEKIRRRDTSSRSQAGRKMKGTVPDNLKVHHIPCTCSRYIPKL